MPVYIDGDSPGAQKLGARFHVSGYPTMVLFSPQGSELTRLPGEVEPERYTQVLTLGMNAGRPVREVLHRRSARTKARPAAFERERWPATARAKLPATVRGTLQAPAPARAARPRR